jgi:anaerobic selenocysteine-containing dehydrogenase
MMAYVILDEELYDREFVATRTKGFETYKEAVLNEISRDEEYFEKNNRGLFDAIEEEDKKKNNLTVNIGVLGTIPLEKWVLSVLRRYKEAYRNEIMDIIELSNKVDLEKAKAVGLIEIKTESLPTIGGIEELPVEYITPIGQVIYEQRILKRYQMV